jgi:RNA polymerase sigma-70 factor (ECF subfamily)
MTAAAPNTDELLARTADGDPQAREQLMARHRTRLRRMVAYYLDRRLRARVDPSDVVQEVLVQAARKLSEYLQQRPLPFYPWLRQLAELHLIDLRRRHLNAQKRSIRREEPDVLHLPDESTAELAARLVTSANSPSQRLLREEARQRVQVALAQLPARDRRVLQLRHLEQLSVAETAVVLGISEGAVKTRNVRALQRLRALLDELGGNEP